MYQLPFTIKSLKIALKSLCKLVGTPIMSTLGLESHVSVQKTIIKQEKFDNRKDNKPSKAVLGEESGTTEMKVTMKGYLCCKI